MEHGKLLPEPAEYTLIYLVLFLLNKFRNEDKTYWYKSVTSSNFLLPGFLRDYGWPRVNFLPKLKMHLSLSDFSKNTY